MREPETTPKRERVGTFAGISNVSTEKSAHTALGDSVDSMERDYHQFKKSRK